MDNVSQLFAVGEYGPTDGAFIQLEKLVPGRTAMSPVRSWVLRFNHTSVVIRFMKKPCGATFGGLTYDIASPKKQSHVILFYIKPAATKAFTGLFL